MKEYIEKSEVERMLWAVIMSKEKRTIEEMLEDAQVVTVIPIPEDATNGEMLTVLFGENALITLDTHNYLKEWWNSPYKKEVEE